MLRASPEHSVVFVSSAHKRVSRRKVRCRLDPLSAVLLGLLLRVLATSFEDASTLALRASAPDAVVDSIFEGVLETAILNGARCADALCHLNPDPIAGEECFGGLIGT